MTFGGWPPPPPTSGNSASSGGLDTIGDPVDVSGAAPPVFGQVLTAQDPTHAIWRVPGLHYDAAVRFNVNASGQATIEPNTWGFVETTPVGFAGPIVVFVVSSLASPPIDSRFGLYVGVNVTLPVQVQLIGASEIMGLDGARGPTCTLRPGSMTEWVFFNEGGVAIWGLVSDTTHLGKALQHPSATVELTGGAPAAANVLTATDPTHAQWSAPAAAQALATTGAAVIVSGAAPPATGSVLTATDATHAQWGASSAAKAFPYLAPHPNQLASSDEFDSGSPDLATRGWTVQNISDNVACTRAGTVNPLNFNAGAVATNTYNSKLVGSTLLMQFPCDGKSYAITKAFTPNANGGYVWARLTSSAYKHPSTPSAQMNEVDVMVCGNSGVFAATASAASVTCRQRVEYTQYSLFTSNAGTSTDSSTNQGVNFIEAGMIYPIRGIKYDLTANRKVNALLLTDQGDMLSPYGTPNTAAQNVPVWSNITRMGIIINQVAQIGGVQPLVTLDFFRVLDGITDWIVT